MIENRLKVQLYYDNRDGNDLHGLRMLGIVSLQAEWGAMDIEFRNLVHYRLSMLASVQGNYVSYI